MNKSLNDILIKLNQNIPNNELFNIVKLLIYFYDCNGNFKAQENFLKKLENSHCESASLIIYKMRQFNIKEEHIFALLDLVDKIPREELYNQFSHKDLIFNESASHLLEDLTIKILGPQSTVLDYCSGEGSFLTNFVRKYPDSMLFGLEIVKNSALLSKINLSFLSTKYKIYNEDALNNNSLFKNQSEFDAIFSNFPINLIDRERNTNLYQRSYFRKHQFKHYPLRDYNWLFAMHIVNLLSDQGKAVVLVPLNMLFRESELNIRNEFLEKGLVETIIQLPEKTLNYVNIPMALMILSNHNEKVRLVDATDAFESSRRVNHLQVDEIISRMQSDSEFSITLSNEELIQNHVSWLPRNILLNAEFDYEGQPLENVIEDIFRGAQIKRSEYETMKEPLKENLYKTYQMVSLSSFDDSIDYDRLETIYTPKAIYDRYILKNHDILLTSRGTLFKLGLVELDSDENLIATGNVAVLRVDATKINPVYLYMFLKSAKGERLLESIRKGSSILVINNKDVLDLKIPIIPLGKQEALAEKYMRLKEQKTLIQNRLNRMDEDITALYDVAGDV